MQTEGSDHKFTFDRVFSPFDTQEAVYEQIGAPIVDAVSLTRCCCDQ